MGEHVARPRARPVTLATDQGPAVLTGPRFTPLALPDGVRLNQISAITTDRDGASWLFDARGINRWTDQGAMKVGPAPGRSVKNIFFKLNVRDRAAALTAAIRRGIIRLE